MKLWMLEVLCIFLIHYFLTEGAAQNCDDDEAEVEMLCPDSSFLLRAMGSRSPFFGDAMSASCTNANEQLYADEESEYSFFSPDGGFSLDARCPDENEIITKISMCVMDGHVQVATISCSGLKDPDRVEERYEATSDDMKNTFVDCGDGSAIQSMNLADAGDGITTKVTFRCLKISLPDSEIPELE